MAIEDPVVITPTGLYSGIYFPVARTPLDTRYRFSTGTTGSPSTGYLQLNNAAPASVTVLYLSAETFLGADVTTIGPSLLKNGSIIYLQELNNAANHVTYTVSGAVTSNAGVVTVPVTHRDSEGTFGNNKTLLMQIYL